MGKQPMKDSPTKKAPPHPVRSDHPLPRGGEGNSNATRSRALCAYGRAELGRQFGRFKVIIAGKHEMVPIGMGHVWELKRNGSFHIFKTAATFIGSIQEAGGYSPRPFLCHSKPLHFSKTHCKLNIVHIGREVSCRKCIWKVNYTKFMIGSSVACKWEVEACCKVTDYENRA